MRRCDTRPNTTTHGLDKIHEPAGLSHDCTPADEKREVRVVAVNQVRTSCLDLVKSVKKSMRYNDVVVPTLYSRHQVHIHRVSDCKCSVVNMARTPPSFLLTVLIEFPPETDYRA